MKKNTGSSTKRRMKKSVRKTIGGLFMASAIMVAAIPFPDAYAYDPATAAIPDYGVTTDDYKYTYNDLDFDSNTDFVEKANSGQGSIYRALIMSKTSAGSWQMDWQYEYWLASKGANGYITAYNAQYSVEDIKLDSRVYSDHIYLKQADVEKFYNSTDQFVNVDLHYGDNSAEPKQVRGLKFLYTISDEYDPTREADIWLANNFPTELAKYRSDYQLYVNNIDPDTGLPSPEYPKPDPLSKSVGDKYTTDTERVQFLCESVFGDGTPTTELITVDKREYAGSEPISWEKVLVPNIGFRPNLGTISIGGHSYYVDTNFYLCDTFATVVGVGSNAFKGVTNVKTLEMAKEISFIGDGAFEESFLASVTLSSDSKIGNRAFYNCTKLSTVDIPEGIRRIGAEAFYGCPIRDLTIPDSCTYIGPGAFARSGNLSNLVFASQGSTTPKTIGKYAFYDDVALNNIEFGASYITEIGEAAFAVKNRETGSMTEFTFPSYIGKDGLDCNIGDYCLAGRENLDYVTIPDNLDGNLKDTIFFQCTGLECVTFGESCYNMTYNSSEDGKDNKFNTMFYTVANKNFYVRGPKLNAAGKAASPRVSTWSALYDYAATGNEGRHVPYVYNEDGKDYYEVSDGNYLMVIEKDTGELMSCTFPSDKTPTDIETFTIPAVVGLTTVTGIKEGCFVGDTVNVGVLDYIVNLVIEDGSNIKTLDNAAFTGADKLETAYIGDSIQSIGNKAFENCPKLEEVTIAKNIQSIGEDAFQNCPRLEDIYFDTPNDFTTFPKENIGGNAFNTGGTRLIMHGEIANGYAPFEWATNPENYANKSQSIRTLYKTPAPTALSVILDNQNNLATLVDYPHYEYLDRVAYDENKGKLVELSNAPESTDPYYGKTVLDKIKNGESLNFLEESMLQNCSSVVIPEGVDSIDVKGFFNDSSANPNKINSYSNKASVNAYFNKGMTPYNTYASEGLFNGYFGNETGVDGPREYEQNNSLEKVDKGNDRLTSVIMNDVVYLPDKAFESCENLTMVYLGDDMKDVGERPFAGCTKITSVGCGNGNFECNNGILYENNSAGKKIIQGLETRGNLVGSATVSLSNDPDLAAVSEIANGAFTDCTYVRSADFTGVGELDLIPESCFEGCYNMTEVDVPINVSEIGKEAFATGGDYIKVTVRNKNLYLGDDSNGPTGDKVKTAYYVTHKDAPSRKIAKRQGYIVDQTLDDVWTVKFYDEEGKVLLFTEYVEDGKNAEGPDESLIPVIPGKKFVGWNQSLKNITSDCFRLAVYEDEGSATPTPNPSATPTATPTKSPGGTTPGGTTPGGTTPGGTTPKASPSATTSPSASKKYSLQVVYGSGSGDYAEGTTVIIEAIDAPPGKEFDKWVVSGNSTPTIYSTTSKATTLKMPAGDCIVTATYKDATGGSDRVSTIVTSRTGGGTSVDSVPGRKTGTVVDIVRPGVSNVDKAYASVSGSTDNFIVRITESTDASNQVATALAQKFGDMSAIRYFAMEISLYDATGTTKISDATGLSVNITMPIPDALLQYAGNNRVGAVNGLDLTELPCKFVTVDGIPCISFTATQFSIPYTIYADTSNLTFGTIDNTPKTGDGIHPKWFVSIALFSMSLILFLKKDRVQKAPKTA
ncbi:MAG: leucine-rich repeat protein [Lachnospiraceae bacterium]|nr:leucine-rich repeat protein [Lachnospiraceae bacterium]